MINEERKSTGGDEYQYPNEEYVAETTPVEEKAEQPKRSHFIVRLMQSNKRVTIVILIIIIALIAFKLLSLRSHVKVIATPKPVVAAQTMPTPVVTTPSPQEVEQLNSLKQDEQTNQLTVSELQNQVQDLHNSLNQSTSAQAQLNQSMVALTEQVKQLEQVVAATTRKPAVRKAALAPAPIVFHLRAIVPGRAWIVSSDGLSESVAQGDSVPQYGTVQVVDANRGMVLTSSGKVIGYGDNDH